MLMCILIRLQKGAMNCAPTTEIRCSGAPLHQYGRVLLSMSLTTDVVHLDLAQWLFIALQMAALFAVAIAAVFPDVANHGA